MNSSETKSDGRPVLYVSRDLPVDVERVVEDAAGRPDLIDVRVHADPNRTAGPDDVVRDAPNAQGLVPMLSLKVNAALLDRLPQLRVVSNFAVGYDNIDVAECAHRGVIVTNTPDVLTAATADLAMTLLLAVARRVREGERMVREENFGGPWHPKKLLGTGLDGKTLGIVGRGRIGSAVAARAAGFGMRVIHHSRSGGVSFEELLQESDVISIHCPLNESTKHMFDGPAFARMKSSAILINTSRGPIVDESALVSALESSTIRGAGLDVYEHEPKVHPGLITRDDVVLLPHVGSATEEARRGMAETALTNAARVLSGAEPLNLVSPSP